MTKTAAEKNSAEEIDLVEELLKKTGCIELHYKVQECIATTQDWRKCQIELKEFRLCMDNYKKKTQPEKQ